MFFDTPLHALLEQAAARPDQLREHYAALLAEIGHRDATLRSMCDSSWEWLVSELDRIGARPVSKSNQGLFGLPVGVKDTIVVGALPTKAGTPADVGQLLRLPQSPAVTALRKAGAVIVAKQETNQFCSSTGPPPTESIRGPAYFAGGSTVGGAVRWRQASHGLRWAATRPVRSGIPPRWPALPGCGRAKARFPTRDRSTAHCRAKAPASSRAAQPRSR